MSETTNTEIDPQAEMLSRRIDDEKIDNIFDKAKAEGTLRLEKARDEKTHRQLARMVFERYNLPPTDKFAELASLSMRDCLELTSLAILGHEAYESFRAGQEMNEKSPIKNERKKLVVDGQTPTPAEIANAAFLLRKHVKDGWDLNDCLRVAMAPDFVVAIEDLGRKLKKNKGYSVFHGLVVQ